jgi:Aspartyl protease
MNIQVRDGLPYVTITLLHGSQQLDLANVLLDTGSAGMLFAADQVLAIGLQYEADDPVQRIRGIGGAEFVFVKRIDRLSVGELQVSDFEIEIGAMDDGFAIDGIIGTDFLLQVGAVIDLSHLEIHRASP